MTYDEEKNPSIKNNLELIQRLKLGNTHIKIVIITIFYMFKRTVETWKIKRKDPNEYLDMKTTMTKMINK